MILGGAPPFFTDAGPMIAELNASALRTAMPYSWGANVFITIGGMEDAINRMGAWTMIAEAAYLEQAVKPFLVYAMALHRARILDMLDGLDVPPEFENRGKYGFLKRAGLLRAEPTSKPGMLFYVDSTSPLAPISGDLRAGIENADSSMNQLNDRSLNGEYVASIAYNEPEYLEAVIRGHRGRYSPRTIAEIGRMLRRMGMAGKVQRASAAVPPRDFITAAWQDLQVDLAAAWKILLQRAEQDLLILAETQTPPGATFDEVYDVMSKATNTVVLGYAQRNTDNVLTMIDRVVTATDLGRHGGVTFLEKDVLFREFSNGMKARFIHLQQMHRGQNPALRKTLGLKAGTTNLPTGQGNRIYIVRNRAEFDALIYNVGTEMEDTRKDVDRVHNMIMDAFNDLNVIVTRDLEVAQQMYLQQPDIAYFIGKSVESVATRMISYAIGLRDRALGIELSRGGTLQATEMDYKTVPMDFPSRAAKERYGKQKGIISRVRDEKKKTYRMEGLGGGLDDFADAFESFGMGEMESIAMSSMSSMQLGGSVGGMSLGGGGMDNLGGFGQSL